MGILRILWYYRYFRMGNTVGELWVYYVYSGTIGIYGHLLYQVPPMGELWIYYVYSGTIGTSEWVNYGYAMYTLVL